jgi:hypothetical protein
MWRSMTGEHQSRTETIFVGAQNRFGAVSLTAAASSTVVYQRSRRMRGIVVFPARGVPVRM